MECPSRRGLRAAALALLVAVVLVLAGFAHSQGLRTSPYGAPSVLRGLSEQGFRQGGSDTVSISSGMFPSILPPIPNLQIGYLYNFGRNVRSGRFTADYLLPFNLSAESTVFGEAHTEFQSFWQNTGYDNRVDVSLGGGYRTIRRNNTLLGVNGFYDTSRLGGTWYSSGGVGFEMAALLPGNDALDLNFNWYGNLFSGNVISNAFRYGPSNFDFQAGYSHQLWDRGPDLRLSATGYKFNAGDSVYGWNAQAELKSRDGALVLRYNVGNDRINKTYHTVGGFVNVGFRPENVLKGENPFTMPEPIFKSPRNLWYMLTQTVKRNWRQPTAALISQPGGACQLGTYRYLATVISEINFATSPPTPLADTPGTAPSSLLVKWCGVKQTTDIRQVYVWFDTYTNIYGVEVTYVCEYRMDDGSYVHVTAPSGSALLRQHGGSQHSAGGSQTVMVYLQPYDIEFETDGGISFDFFQ